MNIKEKIMLDTSIPSVGLIKIEALSIGGTKSKKYFFLITNSLKVLAIYQNGS